jgi:hypothetical protein
LIFKVIQDKILKINKKGNNMKNVLIKTASVALLSTMFLTGCNQAPTAPAQEKPDFRCKQNGQLAPEWTCNPYMEGSIVALGIAQNNAGNDQGMQRAEAVAEGRDALASQISVKVSNMLKSYKATTGSGASATFDKSTSKVSKQIASQTLQGSKAVKTWRDNTGTMYVLVGISSEPVKEKMEDAVKTSFKNDKALYQKFLAAKAQGDLEKELEKSGMQ